MSFADQSGWNMHVSENGGILLVEAIGAEQRDPIPEAFPDPSRDQLGNPPSGAEVRTFLATRIAELIQGVPLGGNEAALIVSAVRESLNQRLYPTQTFRLNGLNRDLMDLEVGLSALDATVERRETLTSSLRGRR